MLRGTFGRSWTHRGIPGDDFSVHLGFLLFRSILDMDKRSAHRDLAGSEVSSPQSS